MTILILPMMHYYFFNCHCSSECICFHELVEKSYRCFNFSRWTFYFDIKILIPMENTIFNSEICNSSFSFPISISCWFWTTRATYFSCCWIYATWMWFKRLFFLIRMFNTALFIFQLNLQ